jgi:hypothetical protein
MNVLPIVEYNIVVWSLHLKNVENVQTIYKELVKVKNEHVHQEVEKPVLNLI